MKNLRKVLVFVLFAVVTVFAFGMRNVMAAEVVAAEVDFSAKTAKNSSYTNKWTYAGWTVSGGANNNGGWGYIKLGGRSSNLATLSDIYVASPVVTAEATRFDLTLYAGSSTSSTRKVTSWGVYVYSDADMANQIDYVEGAAITSAATTLTLKPSTGTTWPANSYFKVKFEVVNTTGTNGIVFVESIAIYKEADAGLAQLDAPVVSVAGKVASWEAVEGAVEYNVGLYASMDATTAKYEVTTEETSYDFTNFVTEGTWYVKAQAVADDVTALSSNYSANEATFTNVENTIECTPTEFLTFIDPIIDPVSQKYGVNTFVLTGTLKAFYTNFAESTENNYDSGYNNTSFYLTDGINSVIVYRVTGEEGANLKVGDVVTVSGKLQNYNGVNQITTGGTYVEIKPLCAVGVQTAAVEGGAHIRFVGGLNANVEDVQSITLTVTCDGKSVTFGISKVFGSLAANTENGVVELTAESQGFESLFALTITNVPSGKTLEVSATVTTAQGTYTSAAKTVTVE